MSIVKVNAAQIGQSVTATNNFTLYQPSTPDGTVRLGNGNAGSVTDLVTVNASGNVGIGTSSPGTQLHLYKASGTVALTAQSGSNYGYFANDGTYAYLGSSVGATGVKFRVALSAPDSAATLDSSGNLGLGVTPSAWGVRAIQVAGNGVYSNAGAALDVSCNAYNDGTNWRYTTSSQASRYLQIFSEHRWLTAPSGTAGNAISFTQAMTLDASGNLLVGTTDASSSISGTSGIKFFPALTTTTSTISCVGSATTNASSSYILYSSGASAYRFYVDYGGSIHATVTSIVGISDISLKENIRPLETGLAEILALQPRRFDWKNGDGVGVAGFVAQEVETILPDLISDYKYNDEETKKGLKMGDMVPTLVKAIQELSAELNEIKKRLS